MTHDARRRLSLDDAVGERPSENEPPHQTPPSDLERLTPVQRRVAELIREGYTNKQIAGLVGVNSSRIRAVVARIATLWHLDRSKDLRVQIANRLTQRAA